MKIKNLRSVIAVILMAFALISTLSCSKEEQNDTVKTTSTTQKNEESTNDVALIDPDFNAEGVKKEYGENGKLLTAVIETTNDKGNITKSITGYFESDALSYYVEEERIYNENGQVVAINQSSYHTGRAFFAAVETVFTYDADKRQITKTVKSLDQNKTATKTLKYFYEYDEDGNPIESFFEYDKDGNMTDFYIP